MPSISRARIVNFYYNDGVRFIPDIIFGFEDSEKNTLDTLLELENGGGKTVLVQLLMQPVVPEARVQSRKISEYFRKNSDHSFVLLEWKLDRSTDRLLTGIAMTGSQNAGETEDNRTVKYFTFINHYNAMGDKFDIVNFPLSETAGGRFIPAAFEKVRSLARGLEYYHSEDVKKYKKRLDDFGINAREWENIIVKINEREGGIDDFIEVYNTADKLLDKFIIPGILNADTKGNDGQAAEGMFLNFAQSCGQADGKMKLREKISGFTQKLEELVPCVTELWELSEENKSAVAQLFDYIYSLKYAVSESEKKEAELLAERAETEEKAAHIALEKHSFNFYGYTDSLNEKILSFKEAQERFAKAECRRNEAEHFGKILLAADKFKSLRETEAEKIRYETGLKKLCGESFDSGMSALRFSLHTAARGLFDETEKQLAELSERIKENNFSIASMSREKSEMSRKRDEMKSETDSLSGQKKQLFGDINKGLEKLQITVAQMLDGSFDTEDIENARQAFRERIGECNERLEKLSRETGELDKRFSENLGEINKLGSAQHDIKVQMEKARGELEEYEKKYKAVCDIVSALSMAGETVFSDEPAKALEAHIFETSDKIRSSERRTEALSEQIKNAEKGNIHMPASAVCFLDSTGVDYQTGTAYLAPQQELRERVLETEPLAAFSVIVSGEKERREIFENVTGDSTVMAAVPVFTYSELAKISEGERVTDGHFLTAYSRDYFNDREKYIRTLGEQLDSEKRSCDFLENSIKDKKRQLSVVQAFDYGADFKSNRENVLQSLSESYDGNEKNIMKLGEDNDRINARKAAISMEERDILKELGKLDRRSEQFDEVCAGMNELYGILQEISENESSLRLLDKQIGGVNDRLERAREQSVEYEDRQKLLEAQRSEYAGVMSETEGERAELLSEKYDILKARYEAAKQKFSEDKRALDENLSRCSKKLAELRRELERMPVTEEEYSREVYSPEKMERAEEKIKTAEEEWKKAFEQKSLLDTECGELRKKVNEIQKLIGNMGKEPLPRSEVCGGRGDFDARIRECERRLAALSDETAETRSNIKKYRYELANSEKISEGYCDNAETHRYTPISDGMIEDIRKRIDRSENALREKENSFLDRIGEELSGYAGENAMFGNVTEHLKGFVKNRTPGDRYFTLREKLGQDIDTLNKQKARLDAELSDIESSRDELVINCLQRSVRLYEGLRMLSLRSKVKIFEQPRQMIKIKLPEAREGDSVTKVRMTRYIEDCVKEYLASSEGADVKKREQQAHRYMDPRRLLSCYIGREEIPVDVYKIGSTAQTGAYRKWETALKANSGGEKFVVFFALVLSMMNYSRSVTGTPGDTSGVLILDNPFGPVSSAHLLRPMFDIARRSHIQLICFTHLATADIVGCFDNAYNLKLKARPLSSIETLESENLRQMEFAFRRGEQMTLM